MIHEEKFDPMDTNSYEEDDCVELPFTSELCLQRQIAYVISTIAFSFLRKKEVAFKTGESNAFETVCLPNRSYLKYSKEYGEALGKIFVANHEGTSWEMRELYQTRNTQNAYFVGCLAGKYVTKEFCEPPQGLKVHVEQLKHQIPVVEEIWKHLHRLLKELSPVVCNEGEWKKAIKFAKYNGLGESKEYDNKTLNFGNPAVAFNHIALQKYILELAEKQPDFISCYNTVCSEWKNLTGRWKCELHVTDTLSLRMTQIRLHPD